MNEHTDWELLDAPPAGARPQPKPRLQDVLKALLGPHWRWKVFGAAVLASMALVLLLTVTGVALLLIAAGALLSIGAGKLRRWLRRERRVVVR